MGRVLPDWLAGYLEYTSEQESPESIHLWTGLTVLSASVRRRVFLEQEYYKIYPNLYVIIVAESARVRKSTAMDIGRDILLEAFPDIKIMRDSMTSQGLIKALNHKVTVIKDDKIQEQERSDVAIFADEVANLFSYDKTRASQMVIFLTRTYGCPSVYDHTTVRDSTVRLHNLYPVLLGGTDPRNLKVLPDDAVGGLTGRLIWIIESARRKNNPGWKINSTEGLRRRALREMLIHDLVEIGRLEGEVNVNEGAQRIYNEWYEQLSQKDTKDPEIDAFYQRCHTTALRVAILIGMSRNNWLKIDEECMQIGIHFVEQQLPTIKRVNVWSGASQFEQHRAKFINYLYHAGGTSIKQKLLQHMGISGEDYVKLVGTLVQDGTVIIHTVGNNEVVTLTKEALARVSGGKAEAR